MRGMTIREEAPGDRAAVDRVNRLAFGGDDEARLVGRLRDDGLMLASLVAVENDEAGGAVVGHILFSALPIELPAGAGVLRAAALAPMAVRPDRQRRGIGSALVRQGLDLCRARGVGAVIVLGHPDFYPRFGFSAALAESLSAPFSGPAFMALELSPGALREAHGGIVRYPSAFGLTG